MNRICLILAVAATLIAEPVAVAQEPGSEVLSEQSTTITTPPTTTPPNNSESSGKSLPYESQEFQAIKAATTRGELLPFAKLARKMKATLPGEFVRVQLFRRGPGIWVYEVAVLGDDGRYTYAVVNAANGDIIRKRTK
jgi:hypothetical protein